MTTWTKSAAGVVLAMMMMMTGPAVSCAPEKPSAQAGAQAAAPPKQAPGQEIVVARVNGEPLTRAEIERRIQALAPHARARLQSPEQRQAFLKSVVQFEVMADAAEVAGYGERPQVRQAMREAMVRLMLAEALKESGAMALGPEALESYYREHAAEFKVPARRLVYELVAESRPESERLRRSFTREAYAETDQALAAFATLAGQYSLDRRSGDRNGLRGWVSANASEVGTDALFETPLGQVSVPYHDPARGWVVGFVAEEEPARQPLLAEVEREVRTRQLEQQKRELRQELIDRLMAEASIEIDQEALDQVAPPPPAIPASLRELPRLPVRDQGAEATTHTTD
ncbi:hypothetical protein DL240_09980 [Lujinxingia litoralis]|uniref:PpiC domain-containing protein n=1 Tax=Lujinxingia litoralis TaxID=2211119 RepID=A0A328C6T5_9DELT|nr:peptidylprolyl isomerase [Lujinxingia litoralis]RAL22174.1 hypothetical protein DL240_09980 [Lujinxingia litoralis]